MCLDMKERAALWVFDSQTKGCYLHGAHLTLDVSGRDMMTVLFPSSASLIPNSVSNKQSW